MSKAILVLDMPNMCCECPMFTEDTSHRPICAFTGFQIIGCKDDRCPLCPLPEKELIWYEDEASDWARGYNSCIDEITGGEE